MSKNDFTKENADLLMQMKFDLIIHATQIEDVSSLVKPLWGHWPVNWLREAKTALEMHLNGIDNHFVAAINQPISGIAAKNAFNQCLRIQDWIDTLESLIEKADIRSCTIRKSVRPSKKLKGTL